MKFYDLKRNPYKNKVYYKSNYLLTTDKKNNENVEWDYNFFKTFGFTTESIKEFLRKLYVSQE